MMNTQADTGLMRRVDEALRRIASVREVAGQFVVNVPVRYPSGAMAVVSVEENNGKCWVSDLGHGLMEAEFQGSQEYYIRTARDVALAFGVEFDGHSIFALQVPMSRLESAIVCVANASNQAAQDAVRLASEAQSQKKSDQIFERISVIFGPTVVAKTRLVDGRHVQWEAHNVVALPNGRTAIFEYMTAHANSVSSKFLMFSDIRMMDQKMSLNVVVQNARNLDAKSQMIGDVANIVEVSAADQDFIQFAAAA
jgi:hypothetical protein